MKESVLKQLKNYFADKIGINPESIAKTTFELALKERMHALRMTNSEEYFTLLKTFPQEEQAFIELIVVPETWFFRERESFDFLKDYIRSQWSIVGKDKHLFILSLPCSSGEETYSIVMSLLDIGLMPHQFHVDGMDINRTGLKKAEEGIYGKHSFRNYDLTFRDRYFEKVDDRYRILDIVRQSVRFSYGNVVNSGFLYSEKKKYTMIFCRNLLMYLNDHAQKTVFHVLDALLEESGIIFTAPAEADLFRAAGYISIKYPMACAFQGKRSPPYYALV